MVIEQESHVPMQYPHFLKGLTVDLKSKFAVKVCSIVPGMDKDLTYPLLTGKLQEVQYQ